MMATSSIMGGVLQLVDLLIIGTIWYPFLKALDNVYIRQASEVETQTAEA